MRALVLGLASGAVLVAAGVGWLWSGLHVPASVTAPPLVFEVDAGESFTSIARRLATHGLLPERAGLEPRALVLFARLHGVDRAIKSGEYELEPAMTPAEILDKLVAGAVKTYPVTLPEGLRLDEIARRLEEANIVAADAFLERARNASFARAFGIPADSFEGYLYPETYRFRRDSGPEEVVRRMFEEHESRWTDADRTALAAAGLDRHQVVTLASIVEKETAVPDERGLVAAVFANRLERGMLLQTDPTVIYGILVTRGSFDGNIRKRDLQTDTPYNTYTRPGLPPGPIASASIESIRAVLDPADVPYLYFVSRNDGTHVFSKTLREHTAAVDRYQRSLGKRGS
jgi:UPF0755 protein